MSFSKRKRTLIPSPIQVFLSGFSALLLLSSEAGAGVPPGFNVQGRLTNPAGINLATGQYKVRFEIQAENGEVKWRKTYGEGTYLKIPVRNGNFQVNLGDPADAKSPPYLPLSDVFTENTLYLEITVESDPPLAPRQQLISVPYALKAEVANSLLIPAVPVGTVLMHASSKIPPGFLKCNGGEYDISTRPELANLLEELKDESGSQIYGGSGSKFNVPDMRGLFPRGWSDDLLAGEYINRDPDVLDRTKQNTTTVVGNQVGSVQEDEFREHVHLVNAFTSGNQHAGGGSENRTYSNSGPAGKSETRPKNLYLMFIIKY